MDAEPYFDVIIYDADSLRIEAMPGKCLTSQAAAQSLQHVKARLRGDQEAAVVPAGLYAVMDFVLTDEVVSLEMA